MKMQVTIIGFGTMGQAIAKALSDYAGAVKVFGIDKHNLHDNVSAKNIQKSDFLILAIKPQDAKEALKQVKISLNKKTILISIMAGVSIKKLVALSGQKRIIRMMPNLGLSVGEGIAFWKASGLSLPEVKKAKNLINKITENFETKNEDAINKVTAISGSGPAYFFLLADCLIKTSQSLGFTQDESRKLVGKTLKASALLSKEADYSELIKKIASKGGTTEAALKVFRKKNIARLVEEAVFSAYRRAQELNNA